MEIEHTETESAENEIPITNTARKEVYYKDLWRSGIEFEELLENKDSREYPYLYYYDNLGGDDNPELCIQVDGNPYFVIKYEKEVDQIASWHEIVRSHFFL